MAVIVAGSSGKAGRLRRAWEKVVDVYDEANYQLDRIMKHPAGEFVMRQVADRVGKKAGQSMADAHTRHQRKAQASLPADSLWKMEPPK